MLAQEQFQILLRDHIKPALGEFGFRKKASTFALRGTDGWAIINFQKDRQSTFDQVPFTINSGISSDLLGRFNDETPDAKKPPKEYECQWRNRIGCYLRGGPGLYGTRDPKMTDRWWVQDSATDPADVAVDIIAALKNHAVPQLLRRMPDTSLLEACRTIDTAGGEMFRATEFAALLHAYGSPEEFHMFVLHELATCRGKPHEAYWRKQLAKLT